MVRTTVKNEIQNATVEENIHNFQKLMVGIFVTSTTGQREIPPNMQQSRRFFLRKIISNDWLTKVNCTVFGLGDSSYAQYNFAGKKLYRRLKQLGAEMVVPIGLEDDQHEIGIDGGLVPLKRKGLEISYYHSILFLYRYIEHLYLN